MAGEAVGFWSYVQLDDAGDHGRVAALADDLRGQYRLQTAEKLELFLDRESIDWGEAWKERIDSAIAGTTFFIPIITPSYFRSPECRRELLKFAREAERLGLGELLMPIYWVRVPELADSPEASPDEAIRLVAKYNWEDLRDERLEDRDSSGYRKSVSTLAEKLADRASRARQVQDVPSTSSVEILLGADASSPSPPSTAGAEGGGGGNGGARATVMPRALRLLEDISLYLDAARGELSQTASEIQGDGSGNPGNKRSLALTDRLAHDLAFPAAEVSRLGHDYGQVLAEADPSIHTRFDLIDEGDLRAAPNSDRFLEECLNLVAKAREVEGLLDDLLASAEPTSKLSRSLRAPIGALRAGLLGVLDGNAVIEEWGQRAREILGDDPHPDEDG